MKKIAAGVLALFGIVGTVASIISITNNNIRFTFIFISILLCLIGLYALLLSYIKIGSAWSILVKCKKLGIDKIQETGLAGNKLSQKMKDAERIRIMAVSGNALIKQRKTEIVSALRDKRAYIQILLAAPDSQFVKDVEESESKFRIGQISPEIINVKNMLCEYLSEIETNSVPANWIGKIEIGYFTTHLRASLVICNDNWGWLTLNLPPKRAAQTVSFELIEQREGLLNDCLKHFDRSWELTKQYGRIMSIKSTKDS